MDYSNYTREELIARIKELESPGLAPDQSASGGNTEDNAFEQSLFGQSDFGEMFNQILGFDFSAVYNDYIGIMINNMSVPVYFTDKQDMILGCNRHFESLLQCSAEEIKGMYLGEVMSEGTSGGTMTMESALASEESNMINYETTIRDNLGNLKEVVVSKSLLKNFDGSVSGIIGVINDVTEKKAAERALVESERKLRDANATKDKFFSIISHDLRSPFATILGFSETLTGMYDELSEEERKSFINDVSDAAKRAFRLVENLLAWARSQLGEIKIQKKPIDIHRLVQELVELYEPQAKASSMQFNVSIPEHTSVFADGDTTMLVLRNLINNAVKFNKEKKSIDISSGLSSEFVSVRIRDHGIGIEPQDIDKVFRIDSVSKIGNSPQKGTGLGLILCKEFMTKNNGTILVDSVYGEYTEFTVLFEPAPAE